MKHRNINTQASNKQNTALAVSLKLLLVLLLLVLGLRVFAGHPPPPDQGKALNQQNPLLQETASHIKATPTNEGMDFNGDENANFLDFALFPQYIFQSPGSSGPMLQSY